MFCEYVSGSDAFPMGGRTTQFNTLIYNPRTALFENPRTVEGENPVCRDAKITQGIPASVVVQNNQMWYHYRCEAKSGSLWLFESRVKIRGKAFGFETEHLLLRLHAKAPALKLVYTLPRQDDANIHKLELTLNARRVLTVADLMPDEKNAFKKFVGETRDVVVDVTQSDDELPNWQFTQLEPDEKKTVTILKGKSKPVAIQRIRRIRKK